MTRLEIPSGLQWVSYLAGEKWPEGDEEALWQIADTWREHAGQLQGLNGDLTSVTNEVLAIYEGQGAQALQDQFAKMFGGDYSFDRLAEGMNGLADMARATGTQIEYTKYNIIASLSIAAIQILAAIANAWWTGGASLGLIPIIQAAIRMAIAFVQRKLLREILQKIAEKAASTAVRKLAVRAVVLNIAKETAKWSAIGAAQELGIQQMQINAGHRDEIDRDQFKTVMKASVVGAAVGGASAHGLNAGANRYLGPAGSNAAVFARGGTIGFISGVAGNGSAMLLTGGHFNAAGFFGSAITGAIPGGGGRGGEGGGVHGGTGGNTHLPGDVGAHNNSPGSGSGSGSGDGAGRGSGDGATGHPQGDGANSGADANGSGSEHSGAPGDSTGNGTGSGTGHGDGESGVSPHDSGSGSREGVGTSGGQHDAGATNTPQSAGLSDSGANAGHGATENSGGQHPNGASTPDTGGGQQLGNNPTAGDAGGATTPHADPNSGAVQSNTQQPNAASQSGVAQSNPGAAAANAATPAAASTGAPAGASATPAAATAGGGAPAAANSAASSGSPATTGNALGTQPVSSTHGAGASGAGAGAPRLTSIGAIADHPAASNAGAASAKPAGAGTPQMVRAEPGGESRAGAAESARAGAGSRAEVGSGAGRDHGAGGSSNRDGAVDRSMPANGEQGGRHAAPEPPRDGASESGRGAEGSQHRGPEHESGAGGQDRGGEQTTGKHAQSEGAEPRGRHAAPEETSHQPGRHRDDTSSEAAPTPRVPVEFVPSTGGHSDPAAIPAHVRESLPGGDGQGQGGRHAANDHDGNGPGRERGPDGNRDDTGPPHRRGESPEEQSQRRQQDEAANRKMAEERIDKQVKALQKSEEAIAKAMKAVPSTEQGVSQVVSHMAHTAPDALTMVVVGTAVTGVAAAKGVHHLVTRAIEAVRAKVAGWRARFGGDEGGAQPHSPASRDGDGHAGSEGRVGDRDGSDGPARELPQSHRDGDGPAGGERPAAGDRVSLGDLPTRASVDEAAGKIDSTNSSGRGCADGAVGMRDLIATGESSVPADRGADYAGQSVNELAGRLGGDRFTHADVESIRATLEGLGDRASATIVGRHPDGELHAVTVMRVDGEFVVVDPSAPAGHRVSDLGAGLKHFSEMGAVFHDGHRPVRASDSRVTHPSELGPRKAFGEHERVGTRRDPEEGTNADGDEDGGSGVGQRHGEDAVDGDHTDSDDAATPVDPAEVARQANHDRIQSVIDDARARQAALNRARLDLEAAEKAGAPKSEIDAAKERVDRAKNDFDVANDRQSREVEGAYNVREDSDGKTHYRRRAGGEAAGYPQLRVDDDGLPALVEPKPPSPGEAAQRQELADALAEARNDPAAARTDPEKVITKVRDEHRDGLRADERARYSRELDESQTNTEHRDNPDNDLTYEYERHAGDHMRPTVDRQELAAQVESQRHGLETRSIDELIASIEGYDSKHRDSTAATRQQRRSELAALVELALLTEGYKPAVATRLASAYSDVQLRGNGSDQVITHNQDQVMGGRRSAETYGDSDANGMLGSLSKNEKDEFLKWLKARSDEFGGSAIYVSIRI